MKRIAIFLILFLVSIFSVYAAEFLEKKSHHFIVYYYKGIPGDFVDKTLEYCERYYKEITNRLGYSGYDFWTWDERAKVYIYPDQETFLKETRQAEWCGGMASYAKKVIWTYPHMVGFFDSLLPHELGHIIFRQVIGQKTHVPLWLEEGVASYQEEAKRYGASRIVAKAIKENKFIPLDRLSMINPRDIKDKEKISLYYIESVSVIDFLIIRYGRASFTEFCRELRSGKSFDMALDDAFGIRNLKELNDLWMEHIKE